jgi:hypothetical protein
MDLAAVLVHLHSLGLAADLLARGNEAGPELGGTVDEIVGAEAPRPALGQAVVDLPPVRTDEALRQSEERFPYLGRSRSLPLAPFRGKGEAVEGLPSADELVANGIVEAFRHGTSFEL